MFSAIIAQVWEELRRKQLRRVFLKAFCDFILPNEIFELAALKRFLASIVENPNTSLVPPRTWLQILDAQRYCFNRQYIWRKHYVQCSTGGRYLFGEQSFETILLKHIKKIWPGAEVITSSEVIYKLKENKKQGADKLVKEKT